MAASMMTLFAWSHVHAEEQATPAAGTLEAPKAAVGIVAKKVPGVGKVTALIAGAGQDEFLIANETGLLRLWSAGAGTSWRKQLATLAIEALAVDSTGRYIAAATPKTLTLVDRKTNSSIPLGARPRAFGFHRKGEVLVTISKDNTIAELSLTNGEVVRTRKAANKREVTKASLHEDGSLVVLGVADG
jgi:WD40 repeat protein